MRILFAVICVLWVSAIQERIYCDYVFVSVGNHIVRKYTLRCSFDHMSCAGPTAF